MPPSALPVTPASELWRSPSANEVAVIAEEADFYTNGPDLINARLQAHRLQKIQPRQCARWVAMVLRGSVEIGVKGAVARLRP